METLQQYTRLHGASSHDRYKLNQSRQCVYRLRAATTAVQDLGVSYHSLGGSTTSLSISLRPAFLFAPLPSQDEVDTEQRIQTDNYLVGRCTPRFTPSPARPFPSLPLSLIHI